VVLSNTISMTVITKAQVQHLGELARIRLDETDVAALQEEMSAIVDYVSRIDAVVKAGALEKKVGAVYNVFREDEVTCESGAYTDALSNEMPERDGPYLRVKKILNPDE